MKYSYKCSKNTIIIGVVIFLFILTGIVLFNRYAYIKKELFTGYTDINSGNNGNHGNTWSNDLLKRFQIYQSTVNLNNNQYNLDILQKQATPQEAETLLETGFWPWPDKLKYEYLDKVWASPIVKIEPQYALNYAMQLYNKRAVEELLAWNTKEGDFLLYGGDLGVTKDMPKNVHNTIKCDRESNTDSNSNSNTNTDVFVMKKKVYTGLNLWNGYMNYKTETVSNEDIPNEMPGFRFVKDACNPCAVLNSPADFSCPFQLNVNGDDTMSSIWKTLWNV
jgi:hypothetical protein